VKKTTDPPRPAIWLLTKRLSAEWRDFIVGNPQQEFATRCGDSSVESYVWFWWQTMRCLGCAGTRSLQSITAWIATTRLDDAYAVCRSTDWTA
jgi:hypothetical protein